jgi:hypothetical protein
MVVSALPLLFSERPLGRALGGSLCFRWLLVSVCGIPAEKLDGIDHENSYRDEGEEHYFLSLLLAVTMGAVCSLGGIAPYAVPLVILIAVVLQLILLYPEIGLLMVAFFAPLMTLFDGNHPTLWLLIGVGITMLAFILKLIGGKRVFRPDLLDSCVLALAALYLFGGLITRGGSDSLSSALVYVALLCCYVLAVGLIRTQAWVRRMVGAISVSLVLVAVLGIAQYLFAELSVQYVDQRLFADLGARVFSTLENPNILAEYLILGLPVLLSVTVTQKRPLNGFWLLLGCGVVGVCLVLTWSRGAWLGALACVLLFLLLMGHKALSYLLLAVAPTVAIVHYQNAVPGIAVSIVLDDISYNACLTCVQEMQVLLQHLSSRHSKGRVCIAQGNQTFVIIKHGFFFVFEIPVNLVDAIWRLVGVVNTLFVTHNFFASIDKRNALR